MANHNLTEQEKKWRAEDDAYHLAQARVIQEDKERFAASQKVAQQQANELKQRANALEKVAKTKKK